MKFTLKRSIQLGRLLFLCIILIPAYGFGQKISQQLPLFFEVEVTNPIDKPRDEVIVFIPESDIQKKHKDFNPEAFVVFGNDQEIPSQYNQNDPVRKGIVLVMEQLKAGEHVTLKVHYKKEGTISRDYTKRTQAEISHKFNGKFVDREYIGGEFKNVDALRVPEEHTDHSWFIRYEGPGWESDRVGYRFYLDWRNAVDVFGKKTTDMVLQNVGQDNFDSYHEMAPWGMDIMKVGESLGIGSIAYYENGKARRVDKVDSTFAAISENGAVYSAVTTDYYGWQVAGGLDLKSHLSIHAGSRLTHQQVFLEGAASSLCTGIGKDAKAKLFSEKGNKNSWGYLATYGSQSLNYDKLGVAVLFAPHDFIEFTADENSHIVRLKEKKDAVAYYYLAAWELEPGGIQNEAAFLDYLQKTAEELANPVRVKVD